jgi:hypothetical protein
MALPRLPGAVDGLRWAKQKERLAEFIRHCDRMARLHGEPLVLIWDKDLRSFLLYDARAEQSFSWVAASWSPTPRAIDTGTFLDFAARVAGDGTGSSGEATGESVESSRSAWVPDPADRRQGLVVSFPVGEAFAIETEGFPLIFSPTGASTWGTIQIRRQGGEESVLTAGSYMAEVAWK